MNPTVVTTHYTQSNKQSLAPVITYLSPNDTPILSTLPSHSNVKNTIHEFVRYELDRPTTNGAVVEGAQITWQYLAPAIRETNWVQEIAEPVRVSWAQRKTDSVGGDKLAFYKKIAASTWAMKLERSILFNTGAAGSTTAARELKGLIHGANVVAHSVTLGNTPTVASFNDGMANIWYNVNPDIANEVYGFLDPNIKSFVSRNFLTSVSRNVEESKPKKLFTNLIAYSSDFGTVNLIAHKDLKNTGRMIFLAKQAYKVAYMEEPRYYEKDTGGYSDGGVIWGAATLEYLYPKAAVKFANVSS